MKNYFSTKSLVQASIIAALYAALTVVLAPISYGPLQFRVSEALTVLPFFTPAAIPGLFVGCVLANAFSPVPIPIYDVIFGSAATLIAAYLSYKMPKKILVPLPPIIINGIIVGYMLHLFYEMPLLATILWVALGEAAVCYVLGYPLILALDKHKYKIFR